MSKCLKCGASLPPVGDCPTCAAASQLADRAVPSLLDKEIQIDRRRPDRDAPAMAPVPPPVAPAAPPGMTARAPVPPGMTPAGQAPRPQQAPGLPVMPPRAQAPAAQMAPKAPAAPAPRPVAAPSAPMAPPAHAQAAAAPRAPTPPPQAPSSLQLPGVAAPAPRSNTPAFGVPSAAAPAPALKQASTEEESFSVDVDDSEAETLPATPMPTPRRPPPPALAPASATAKASAESGVTEVHARPASLWRRLLAFTIDTGAMAGVAALYLLLASTVAGVHAPQTGLSGLDAFVIQVRALQSVLIPGAVLLLVLSLVYCAVAAFLWNGRTLGRRLLGLRLVDTHGLAPAPGRAIARAVLASLSFGLFLAGFWMALFDRRGQTLHDKLTSTYVVQPS